MARELRLLLLWGRSLRAPALAAAPTGKRRRVDGWAGGPPPGPESASSSPGGTEVL